MRAKESVFVRKGEASIVVAVLVCGSASAELPQLAQTTGSSYVLLFVIADWTNLALSMAGLRDGMITDCQGL
jgi:hypothetical protein